MSRKGPTIVGKKKNRTGTVNGNRGNEVLSQEAVRLFKTQDLGYVRTMRNKALKEMEALEMRVKGIRGEGKKVVFVDYEAEQSRRVDHMEDEDMDDEEEEEDKVEVDIETKNLRKLQQKEMDSWRPC